MLNLLPKSMIVGNIVDTLIKDPENGVIKLLETASVYTKKTKEQALLTEIINYYKMSKPAKMQIRNLIYNTNHATLYNFADAIYDSLKSPVRINFLKILSLQDASNLLANQQTFPIIELPNLGEHSQSVLEKLKNSGIIFFATITINGQNYDIATSEAVIMTLIRNGVRAIFYQTPGGEAELISKLEKKIKEIRTTRPLLAFHIKKDATGYGTSSNYIISETINNKTYNLKLQL